MNFCGNSYVYRIFLSIVGYSYMFITGSFMRLNIMDHTSKSHNVIFKQKFSQNNGDSL